MLKFVIDIFPNFLHNVSDTVSPLAITIDYKPFVLQVT